MVYFSRIILVVLSTFMLIPSARCEETANVELEKIVVTPLGTEQSYGTVSRSMDIIDKHDLSTVRYENVSEPVGRLTSSQSIDYGSEGALKTIRLRGSSAEQVLIMIDSRPITDSRTGQAELHAIPIDSVEKIEVIKGPASAVYGSSAIGGVVNIITKKPSKKPKTVIESSFGNNQTLHDSLSTSATINDFGYYFNYSYDSTHGSRDNSEYRSHNWTARLDYKAGEDNRIFFNTGYFQDKGGAPGSIFFPTLDNFQLNYKNYYDLGWTAKLFEESEISLRAYQNNDKLVFINSTNPFSSDAASARTRGMLVQYSQKFFDCYKVIAGFDGKMNRVDATLVGKHKNIVRSPFVQNEFSIGKDLEVNFGFRDDDYSNFKGTVSPSAGAAYKIGEYSKLRVNYAKGFRAPTFNDLYWPFDGFTQGNPNLRPEKSWSWEGGFDLGYKSGLQLSATYFTNKLKDLIDWAPGDDFVWRPSNISSAKIDGVEFKTVVPLTKSLKFDFGYSYLNAMDVDLDRYLIYRAKNKFDMGLILEYDKWDVRFYGESLGRRYTDTANTAFLKKNFVAYLDASYKINNNLTTFVSIDNIFNRSYQLALGYPMPGFAINGGIRGEF
ncbi:MAG: TonB-dependent receptor [Candidatus Omnitrophica bacterium]|nr:TonB-dependent receptor [Candidatus Omnitrophota bacterium]